MTFFIRQKQKQSYIENILYILATIVKINKKYFNMTLFELKRNINIIKFNIY